MPISTPLTALSGHPASDPAGADGRDRRRAPDGGGQRRRRVRHSRRRLWRRGVAGAGDRQARQIASAPFGIGFITWSLAKQPELLDIALDAQAARDHAVVRRSQAVRAAIKAAGALLICQVQNEDMARQALDAGADILIAQGTEAGGHGASRTTHRYRAGDRRSRGRPRAGCRRRRHRRRPRAGGDDDAGRFRRAARHALLCQPWKRRRRGSEAAHLRGHERQQRPRHHLRSVAQQCLAGAVHRRAA